MPRLRRRPLLRTKLRSSAWAVATRFVALSLVSTAGVRWRVISVAALVDSPSARCLIEMDDRAWSVGARPRRRVEQFVTDAVERERSSNVKTLSIRASLVGECSRRAQLPVQVISPRYTCPLFALALLSSHKFCRLTRRLHLAHRRSKCGHLLALQPHLLPLLIHSLLQLSQLLLRRFAHR